MTPRRLDPSIVQTRLSVMRGLLDDLAEVDAAGKPPLAENRMLRHGIERILTQLVELATAINEHIVGAVYSASPPPIGTPSSLPRNAA
ncbi:MAG: hypothetical protein ACRDSF_23625 [Pseudonocardiaceae bacterium]